jgi:hypothetical protein
MTMGNVERFHKSHERALEAAKEYYSLVSRGDYARARETRNTIHELVAYFLNGVMMLPRDVRLAMRGETRSEVRP